jgi:hypothetical protein
MVSRHVLMLFYNYITEPLYGVLLTSYHSHPAQGITIMPSNQTHQIAIHAALAFLTAAVIAVELLPTGASAENAISQSTRPSGKNHPQSHGLRLACDRTVNSNCEDICFDAYSDENGNLDPHYLDKYSACKAECARLYLSDCP